MSNDYFQFRQFAVRQDRCAMKVGTDAVLLGAWAPGGKRILDIGCGTGIIALMMAQRFPDAKVSAVDIDADCCSQATENVAASPFADRIDVHCQPIQQYSGENDYDAIVSNPPFFVNALKSPDEKRSLARATDHLPYHDLFAAVSRLLSPDGVFSAVIPTDMEEAFTMEGFLVGLRLAAKVYVRTVPRKQPKRMLVSFSQVPDKHRSLEPFGATVEMKDKDGTTSQWLSGLTKDFFL